jgi:hypothetical protein
MRASASQPTGQGWLAQGLLCSIENRNLVMAVTQHSKKACRREAGRSGTLPRGGTFETHRTNISDRYSLSYAGNPARFGTLLRGG